MSLNIHKYDELTLEPGLTVLVGCNGSGKTTFLNVIGGLEIDEPASDLGIAMALISSLTDKKIPDDLIAIGEIGLAGECRGISSIEQRVKEAARLGFTTALIPASNAASCPKIEGIKIYAIKTIYDVLKFLKNENKN